MARRAGTSVRSRRLAHTLRKLRTTAGFSIEAVAEAVGMSGSKISRIETSELGVYLDDLEKLLDCYRVGRGQRVELLDLARHAGQRGLLRMNNQKLPGDWQTWADFEDEAGSLLNYEPLVVPGLLQTPEYARALIRATGHALTDPQVDSLVASRMSRQGLLSRSVPLKLSVIIEQSVFERPFHDPGAQRRQIRHLIDAGERPNVTVRVIPTDAELHAGLSGPFVILEYDDDPSLVLLENKVSSLFIDEDEQIEVFEATWAALRRLAYTEEETLDYLKGLA
ncbi:helix-turn-helix domain-containing protein [Actinosynnema sp. NPDC053489]|uniref:helix-turn-helix domain-containing protein n=1 Tax=Actinosynnema sp. NPDC053489 TaxID=3363916 RepID=UPI0037CAAB97